MTGNPGGVDLAAVGALFGDTARALMLAALADGRALPAGELARRAGVSPATATTHLRRLIEGGLIQVTVQGRHRYHVLAGPLVFAALEALAQLAPAVPVTSLREHRDDRAGRSTHLLRPSGRASWRRAAGAVAGRRCAAHR